MCETNRLDLKRVSLAMICHPVLLFAFVPMKLAVFVLVVIAVFSTVEAACKTASTSNCGDKSLWTITIADDGYSDTKNTVKVYRETYTNAYCRAEYTSDMKKGRTYTPNRIKICQGQLGEEDADIVIKKWDTDGIRISSFSVPFYHYGEFYTYDTFTSSGCTTNPQDNIGIDCRSGTCTQSFKMLLSGGYHFCPAVLEIGEFVD